MKLILWVNYWFILVNSCILWNIIDAGGGGGSRYVNTGSYSGKKHTNESIYEPLLDVLFEGYNPLALPLCKHGHPLNVMIDMWLYQLFDLDEPKQELTVDVWIDLNWIDCSLVWDPKKYNEIKELTLPTHEIWFPDIFAYQGLHGNYEEGLFVFRESKVKVMHTGQVQMGAQLLLKTFCRVNILEFPFDSQECPITFSAWNKDLTVFNMTKKPKHDDISGGHSFEKASNGEWNVKGLSASNGIRAFHVGTNEDQLEQFSEVQFLLKLTRKPNFIMIYLVFPCVLLLWLATIGFILPVSSGEKIGLVSTVLLSMIVFLLVVAENVPHTSDHVPYVAWFFFTCIGLVTIALVLTTIVLNISHKNVAMDMPKLLKKFLHSPFADFFCYSNKTGRAIPLPADPIALKQVINNKSTKDQEANDNDELDECAEIAANAYNQIHHEKINSNRWSDLGLLLDRIFMIIYIILSLLATLYILAKF